MVTVSVIPACRRLRQADQEIKACLATSQVAVLPKIKVKTWEQTNKQTKQKVLGNENKYLCLHFYIGYTIY